MSSKKTSTNSLTTELLAVLVEHRDGISDDRVRSIFGAKYEQLAPVINSLLASNRVQLFTQGGQY